jgi:hypothetical protein
VKTRGTIDGVSVQVNLDSAAREVPYAAAVMLTRLGGDVRSRFQRRMPEVFDRPTDFTVRGVFTKGATRAKLEAEVYFPESQAERGRPQRECVRPGTKGTGARNQKKTEFLLTRIGALPPGWVTTPGRGAKLDAHGNLAGSVYKQIINVLQIRYNKPKPVSDRSRKTAAKLGVAALFFAIAPGPNKAAKGGGWLPPGVWKHLPDGKITQILKFVKKAGYRPRLRTLDEAKEVVGAQAAARWSEASAHIRAKFARGR